MKKIFFAIAAFAALLSFTNCQKETVVSENNDDTVVISQLNAEILSEDPQTKTLYFADGHLTWNSGDKITVIYSVNNNDWSSSPITFYYNSTKGVFEAESAITLKKGDNVRWIATYNYPQRPADVAFNYLMVPYNARTNGKADTSGDTTLGLNIAMYGTTTTVGDEIPVISMKTAVAMLRIKVINNSGADITFDTFKLSSPQRIRLSGYVVMDYTDFNNITLSGATASSGSFNITDPYNYSALSIPGQITVKAGGERYLYTTIIPQTIKAGTSLNYTLTVGTRFKEVIPERSLTLNSDLILERGKIKTINYYVVPSAN